jgi:hypothetical protein
MSGGAALPLTLAGKRDIKTPLAHFVIANSELYGVRLMRRFAICIAVLAIAGLLAPPAHTQVLYGSIVGGIEDQSGSVVPKANVIVTN